MEARFCRGPGLGKPRRVPQDAGGVIPVVNYMEAGGVKGMVTVRSRSSAKATLLVPPSRVWYEEANAAVTVRISLWGARCGEGHLTITTPEAKEAAGVPG